MTKKTKKMEIIKNEGIADASCFLPTKKYGCFYLCRQNSKAYYSFEKVEKSVDKEKNDYVIKTIHIPVKAVQDAVLCFLSISVYKDSDGSFYYYHIVDVLNKNKVTEINEPVDIIFLHETALPFVKLADGFAYNIFNRIINQ